MMSMIDYRDFALNMEEAEEGPMVEEALVVLGDTSMVGVAPVVVVDTSMASVVVGDTLVVEEAAVVADYTSVAEEAYIHLHHWVKIPHMDSY